MTAIVTGSDSGIGRATAVALALAGHDIGVTYHSDEHGARDTAQEVEGHGRRAVVRALDTSDLSAVQATVGGLADELGAVDVLVNNAGTGHMTPFVELELGEWRRVLDTDLTGAFLVAQECARRMIGQGRGGRIVNVTSVHEHVPLRGNAAYASAKGGLGLLTKVMAVELAAHDITVNAVAPGEIATPMTGQADEVPARGSRSMIPLGRPGDAREVAATIAFLCSEAASYVTGASYVVDGGLLLMAGVANQDAGG